ncbi:hypothetical protein HK097_010816, partial [Rhizophlyctis rosea]
MKLPPSTTPTVLSSQIILPPTLPPTTPLHIPLHPLDHIGSPIQIKHHAWHRLSSSSSSSSSSSFSFDQTVDRLKESLEKAMALFPPTCGTIRTDDDGVRVVDLTEPHRQGALFVVQEWDVPYYLEGGDDLVKDSQEEYDIDEDELAPRQGLLLPEGERMLAVKITKFSNNTIAICTSIHHQITDLSSFQTFLHVWASLARNKTPSPSLVPTDFTHTAERYFPPHTLTTSTPPTPEGFTILSEPPKGPPAFLLQPADVSVWVFGKEALERLKEELKPKNGEGFISTGDALAALLCTAIHQAREAAGIPRIDGRSSDESGVEVVAMAADARDRSSLSKEVYFGNFNPLVITPIPRASLLSHTSSVASHIRSALMTQLSPTYLSTKLAYLSHPPHLTPFFRPAWKADIILTNWCKFDLRSAGLDVG